jgi:hypothetical protein
MNLEPLEYALGMVPIMKKKEDGSFLKKMRSAREEKEGMLRVLIKIYEQDGWYLLKGITELFKEQMDWKRCSSQRVSRILKDLGFKKRKRIGGESLTHVFINKKILDRQAKAIGFHRRTEDTPPSRDDKTDFQKTEKNSEIVISFDYDSRGESIIGSSVSSEKPIDFEEALK